MAPAPGFSPSVPPPTSSTSALPSSSSSSVTAPSSSSHSEVRQADQTSSGHRDRNFTSSLNAVEDADSIIDLSTHASSSSSAEEIGSGPLASGIKTCIRCGRSLELSSLTSSSAGVRGENTEPARQLLPHHAILTDNSASQQQQTPAMHSSITPSSGASAVFDEDPHQVCPACLAAPNSSSAMADASVDDQTYTLQQQQQQQQQQSTASLREARAHLSRRGRDAEDEAAVREGLFPAVTPRGQQSHQHRQEEFERHQMVISSEAVTGSHEDIESAMEADDTSSVNPASTATSVGTSSSHPWRRGAGGLGGGPWARILGQTGRPSSSSSSGEGSSTPLSISVANIGAGGDADVISTPGEGDFPPLSQTLSPTAARSARMGEHPTSPGGSSSAGGGPVLGRQSSFSRSQTSTAHGVVESGRPSSPVVSFPSRGRTRTGSASSLNAGGVVATSSGSNPGLSPTRPRRPSNARRLSRSSSSQGPTAVSFADLIEVNSTHNEVHPSTTTESIAENPFGPETMTRPRIGNLTTAEIEPAEPLLSTTLVSRYELPYTVVIGRRREQERSQGQDEEGSSSNVERLRWFDVTRPDPKVDISRLRSIGRGRGCLHPGAIFNGIQKSGRNSYDVTVQIVNVDLAASHLCGYLNIRGLTDDWPELTTYFDAEIIGSKYGFVTGKWGATEAEDMKHWSRFTPFRPLRSSLTKPGLKFNHMNKPFIFMRWKERFLVPDHRVRDINGASFAGFYYVCVELGDQNAAGAGASGQGRKGDSLTRPLSPSSPPLSPSLASSTTAQPAMMHAPASPYGRTRTTSWRRPTGVSAGRVSASRERQSSMQEDALNAVVGMDVDEISPGATAGETPMTQQQLQQHLDFGGLTSGRMSGFYFHEHSEPYQQLTLQHQPERSSSSFELR